MLYLGRTVYKRLWACLALYWRESDITSKWTHRESNVTFTLNSDQRKKVAFAQCKWILGVNLYWSESDINFRWVQTESGLMVTLSNDKDKKKSLSFSGNEP